MKLITDKINAFQLQFVLINAAIGPGIVKGSLTIIIGTICVMVAKYETVAVTNGPIINGIPSIGFNTIGAPKIIGSLILNRPGKIDSFPKSFKYFDFENINKTTNANVPPAPPIHTNHCKNCSVNIVGNFIADTPA